VALLSWKMDGKPVCAPAGQRTETC